MVGINALIDAGPRTASCVASSAGWLYRIELEHLRNPPAAAAVWWKEAMLFNLAHQLRVADESLARLKGMPMELGHEDLETLETAEVDPLSEELEELHTAEIEMLTAEVLESADHGEDEFLAPPDLAPEAARVPKADADEADDDGEHTLPEQSAASETEDSLFYPTGTDEVVGSGETFCPPIKEKLAEPELPPEDSAPAFTLRPDRSLARGDGPLPDPYALPENCNLPEGFPYPETPTLSDVQAPPKRTFE